jgi:hypothetical protein
LSDQTHQVAESAKADTGHRSGDVLDRKGFGVVVPREGVGYCGRDLLVDMTGKGCQLVFDEV